MAGVELRAEGPQRFGVVVDDEPMGRVTVVDAGRALAAVCEIWGGLGLAHARELIAHLDGFGVTEIDVPGVLVRLAAREAGYGGPLRSRLSKGLGPLATDLAAQVADLLPTTTVHARPHGSGFQQLVAYAARGMPRMTRLKIKTATGPALRIHIPERDDQIAEVIALAVDTTLAVRARFGRAVDHVREISFDQASHGMSDGKIAGMASHNPPLIHINGNFSFARGIETLMAAARARQPAASSPTPTAATPATAWTAIDRIVAHELWHKMEMGWEARHYAQTIEFRRELGGWFGHPTLEAVFHDPDAQRALAAAVSPYAATARLEATAEMFEQWWCGPAPAGSIAERFGSLVDTYFPKTGGVQG